MGLFSRKLSTYTEKSAYSWSNMIAAISNDTSYMFYDSFKGYTGEELSNMGYSAITVMFPGFENWKFRECFLPFVNSEFMPVSRREGWQELKSGDSRFIDQFQRVAQNSGVVFMADKLPNGATLFHGRWKSGRGNTFVQSGIFYRNEKGQEVLYWKADVLTFPSFTEEDLEGIFTMSVNLTQPAIFQAALMLAESPLPSSTKFLINFSRKLGYGEGFPEKLLPRPVLDFASSTMYVKVTGEYAQAVESPFVTGLGFEISSKLTDDQLSKALVVIMDSLTNVFTIIEDGYINYGPGSPTPYDAFTLAPGLGEEIHKDRWIPISLL